MIIRKPVSGVFIERGLVCALLKDFRVAHLIAGLRNEVNYSVLST